MNMKSIKTVCVLFIMTILNCSLQSCEKEYVSELTSLTFQDMTFGVNVDVQEQTFTNHDLSNYSISSSESWCVARIDVENSKILVGVENNKSYDERAATITIKDFKDGVSVNSFTVSQNGNNGIEIDTKTYVANQNGDMIEVTVMRNVDYEVAIDASAKSWVSVASKSGSRGLEPSIVVFKVEKNRSGKDREAAILIYNEKEQLSQSILITQKFKAVFSVKPKDNNGWTVDPQDETKLEYTCDELRNETGVNVTANFDVDLDYREDWVTPVYSKGEDEDHFSYTLKIQPFREKAEKRTTNIYIQNPTTGQSAQIKVTQYRTLYIKKENYTLLVGKYLAMGEEEVVNVNDLNVLYESTDTTVATVNAKGRVDAVAEGYCMIKIKSEDGLYSDFMDLTVNKPYVPTDHMTAEWDYEYSSGKVSAVGSTFINNSTTTVYLKSYTLYNGMTAADSTKVAGSEFSRTVNANSYYSLPSAKAIDSAKPYFIEWVFTCEGEDYKMVLKDDKTVTITKLTAVAATRRASSRKARSRK